MLLPVLGLAFYIAFIPHQNYPYPLHVDEWLHLVHSRELIEAGSITFPGSFLLEVGFHLFWGVFQQLSGISWMAIFRYFPAIIFMLTVLSVYIILFLLGHFVAGWWQMVSLVAFYCALGQSWNIFMGMTGYVDFGYVTFIALGAYGMALGITNFHQYEGLGIGIIFVGLLLALLLASASALIEASIALRLRGAYFAIACIGINEGLRYLGLEK